MEYVYVYCHTNKINKKKYIGITINPENRWASNGNNYKDSPKFWFAIKKYGWNNFTHEILFVAESRDEARQKEIELIKEFNSIENGYNISKGGDAPPILRNNANPNFGGISEEAKKKMSDNHADFSRGKHPRSVKCICVEDNIVFDCITDAAEYYHVSRKCISDCCSGRQKTSKNKHFKYLSDSINA